MNLFFDFFLVIAFLITFKLFDIYVATAVAIAGSTLQVIGTRLWLKRFENKQILIMAMLMLFGGMTLYFHNPIFIKWKPTVLFWLLGVAFILSQFIGAKSLIERMVSPALDGKKIPGLVWKRLNMAWSIFFLLLGAANIIVAYRFNTNTWVNFKVYGIFSALFIFGIFQSFYLARYLTKE